MTNLRGCLLLTFAHTRSRKRDITEEFGLLKEVCIISVVCIAVAIAAPAQTFTTLYNFDGTHGSLPAGLIQATDGTFYGTTDRGGASSNCQDGCGTVFQITPGGSLTTIYNFCAQTGCPDGAYPSSLIQATDGNFYGTTFQDGAYGYGTVFQITPAGTLTTLYSFCTQANCTDGANPVGLIQADDGNFYGTTFQGGALSTTCNSFGCGTVFKMTPAGTLTTLYSLCSQTGCADGSLMWAALMQATDGNFYGTTLYGGTKNFGTVFRITPAGTLTTLHSFDSTEGTHPYAGLMQGSDGNFYGATGAGAHWCPSNGGCGTVFQITLGGALTTLHSFDHSTAGSTDGANPMAGLIQGSDGNFYGTTAYGGPYCPNVGCGTVFEMTPGGTVGTLHSFKGVDGVYPRAGLMQATDGNFYGTTRDGGANKLGTVFRLAVTPAVTLSSTSFSFGSHALDETSAAKVVTLKNSGTALLNISGITINGSSFAISANTCGDALAMGKTCKVSVTFTPTVLGTLTGTLTFTDNASNSPQRVLLSGTGVEPATLMPAGAAFGTWVVSTTSTAKTFTLANNQSVALTGIAVSTTGDFALSATTCTTSLAAKSRCTISVTFTPTALGKRTGVLTVSDSASSSPQTAALAGMGVLPATLTPATATYALQAVGTTSLPKTFTLTNNQIVSLTGITIAPTGDFAVLGTTCTTSLAAKSKCTISVTFTPTAIGMRTGKLSVSDSANNSPQTSNLKGTGT